jgi:hypothetical protein
MDTFKLVEGCPNLNINFIKEDLLRYKKNGGDVSGIANIGYDNNIKTCNYWFDSGDDMEYLMISFNGSEPQKIKISEQELSFGTRHYFVCDCGRQACRLFMPDGKTKLRCRSCYGLNYELSMINRNSIHGRLLYVTNRKLKLINKQITLNRIFYMGRYTQRYVRFLKLCQQAGLNNVIENAKELMEAVQNQNP